MSPNPLNPVALGLAVAERRHQLGFSRPELASAASISYPYLYEIERGKKLPSTDALDRIAGAMDIERFRLESRSHELAENHGFESEEPAGPKGEISAPMAPAALALHVDGSQDEAVERLTAVVMGRIEPIVRDAIAAALRESR